MSTDVFRDMGDMHDKMCVPHDGSIVSAARLDFRFLFLLEELIEMDCAIESKDADGVVDAAIDLIVVALGMLDEAGVDANKAWNEVLRANMSKQPGTNSTRSGSGGVDLVKPEGWEPPDHSDNVGNLPFAFTAPRVMPYSITVLFEAILMQKRKLKDYNAGLRQASRMDYWIHGMSSLEYELNKKNMRMRSVLEIMRSGDTPSGEPLDQTHIDSINYNSFSVAVLRGREIGQRADHDIFNNPTK